MKRDGNGETHRAERTSRGGTDMPQDNAAQHASNGATMSAQEVADALGVDAKTFRAWVRRTQGGTLASKGAPRGARYAFNASEIEDIKRAFGASGAKTHVVTFAKTDDATK